MQRRSKAVWVSGAGSTRTSAARRLVTSLCNPPCAGGGAGARAVRMNEPTAMLMVDRIECPSIRGQA